MHRPLLSAALILAAAPAIAKEDVPLSPVGLPFAPAAPSRLPADHPLYGQVVLAGLDGVPDKMGPVRREAFAAALSETLGRLDMLATDPAKARFRLSVVSAGVDSPFKVSFSSRAVARMTWRLARIDTGQVIFEREIATAAEAKGGSATERRHGVGRIAVMSNIASAALCLDKAAYGHAPADCALTPAFDYRAPMPDMVIFYRR